MKIGIAGHGRSSMTNAEVFRLLKKILPSDSCDGCANFGKYENEVEYGAPSPCTTCKRRVQDNYTT